MPPKAKKPRREPPRPKPPEIPPLAVWFIREILPLLRRPRRPPSKSAKHLRNAGIEVLEAMRACLDAAIERLRHEERPESMRRIEVKD